MNEIWNYNIISYIHWRKIYKLTFYHRIEMLNHNSVKYKNNILNTDIYVINVPHRPKKFKQIVFTETVHVRLLFFGFTISRRNER